MKILRIVLMVMFVAVVTQARNIYVNDDSPANGPGTSWGTAYQTIQAGVDAAVDGDVVLVAAGSYSVGSRYTPTTLSSLNRVVITKNITVKAVGAQADTTIFGDAASGGGNGSDAVRCVYMSAGMLEGFSLAGGHTSNLGPYPIDSNGGAVVGEDQSYCVVVNCNIRGNSAAGSGGGCFNCVLQSCNLNGNVAVGDGGGSCKCDAYNCSFLGNQAWAGGGANGG
jgi:hypothetical protein